MKHFPHPARQAKAQPMPTRLSPTGPRVILALTAFFATTALSFAAPSFDCRKARTPVEKEICARKPLGDMDRAMAKAYPIALARIAEDAEAVVALKASQRLFLMGRNEAFTPHPGNDYDLAAHMAAQLDLLRSIGPDPRRGLQGDWKTSEGMIHVGPAKANGLRIVNLQSQTHDSKRWTCEFLGEAKGDGDELIVEGRDKFRAEYAGWRLRILRKGRMAEVEALPPAGASGGAPFCGMNGTLAGRYFPADELPDNPCAGVPAGQCRE